MNIYELIKLSIRSLFSFKFRSFLTTLGIIVGIGSVVLISSIGAGFEKSLLGDFKKNYSKIVLASVDDSKSSEIEITRDMLFREKDLINIKQIKNVETAFISSEQSGEDPKNNEIHSINFLNYDGINGLGVEITSGRNITREEHENKAKVMLLSRYDANRLFGNEKKAIGKIITTKMFDNVGTINNLTVVGTFKDVDEKFRKLFGGTEYKSIIAPISLIKVDYVRRIHIKLNDENKMQETIEVLKKHLRIKSNNNDIYSLDALNKDISSITDVLNKISIFISLIASISLIVGGIGVMNIMLVSVTERISEIGLRKAIGSKNKDILLQFLIESVILTVIGGIMGIIIGYLIAVFIGLFFSIVPILKLSVLMTSTLVSMSIGLIFGIYPAKKASRLSPIEALKTE